MPLIDRIIAAGYLDSSCDEDAGPKKGLEVGKTRKGKGKNKSNGGVNGEAKLGPNGLWTLGSEKCDDNNTDKADDRDATRSDTASTDQDSDENIDSETKIKKDGEARVGQVKDESFKPANDEDADDGDDEDEDDDNVTPDTTPPSASPALHFSDYENHLADLDAGYASDGSDMSELQIRNDERVQRTVDNSHGYFNVLGRADCLLQRSAGKLPPPAPAPLGKVRDCFGRLVKERRRKPQTTQTTASTVIELTYPTGDDNAVNGYYLSGFKDGKRVYRLESPFLPLLQAQAVKTAVGFCYIDIPAVCPPKVVTVPAKGGEVQTVEAAEAIAVQAPAKADDAVDTGKAVESTDSTDDAGAIPTPESSMGTPTDSSDSSDSTGDPTPVTTKDSDTTGTTDMVPFEDPDTLSSSLPPALPQPTLEVNGLFAIRPSALGGLGCFALRDLTRGEHLLVERPLLLTNLHHLFHDLEALSPADRAHFDALHGWHPDPRATRAEKIWTANTFVAGELDGLFVVASRFNHACSGSAKHNVGYRYDRRQNVLVLTAVKRIAAGTELLISYGKSAPMLQDRFGFVCDCGACEGLITKDNGSTVLTADELYRRMWS